MFVPRSFGGAAGVALVIPLALACSSSNDGNKAFAPGSTEYTAPDGAIAPLESPGTCSGARGGPVSGPEDTHCIAADGGNVVQVTTAAGCTAMAAGDAGPAGDDGGSAADAGDLGNCGDPSFGATMFNGWGSDDDCKYDVKWTSTPICENQPVYFTVLVTRRTDGSALTGAHPLPDVVLSCTHPIPSAPAPRDPAPEVAPGTYVLGPMSFDKAGRWVLRFHFDENCLDNSPESPHGHAAFYLDVP